MGRHPACLLWGPVFEGWRRWRPTCEQLGCWGLLVRRDGCGTTYGLLEVIFGEKCKAPVSRTACRATIAGETRCCCIIAPNRVSDVVTRRLPPAHRVSNSCCGHHTSSGSRVNTALQQYSTAPPKQEISNFCPLAFLPLNNVQSLFRFVLRRRVQPSCSPGWPVED